MKQIIFILLLLVLIGCKPKIDLDSGQIAVFKGKLDTKYPVTFWLAKKENLFIGQIFYSEESKKPAKLVGLDFNGLLKILEYLDDGSIPGKLVGRIVNNSFVGYRYSFTENRKTHIRLRSCDAILSKFDSNMVSENCTGYYIIAKTNCGTNIKRIAIKK